MSSSSFISVLVKTWFLLAIQAILGSLCSAITPGIREQPSWQSGCLGFIDDENYKY